MLLPNVVLIICLIAVADANLRWDDDYLKVMLQDFHTFINNVTGSNYRKVITMPEIFTSPMQIKYSTSGKYAELDLWVSETNCTMTREESFDPSECVPQPVSIWEKNLADCNLLLFRAIKSANVQSAFELLTTHIWFHHKPYLMKTSWRPHA